MYIPLPAGNLFLGSMPILVGVPLGMFMVEGMPDPLTAVIDVSGRAGSCNHWTVAALVEAL